MGIFEEADREMTLEAAERERDAADRESERAEAAGEFYDDLLVYLHTRLQRPDVTPTRTPRGDEISIPDGAKLLTVKCDGYDSFTVLDGPQGRPSTAGPVSAKQAAKKVLAWLRS
jgi:hypothetical protein